MKAARKEEDKKKKAAKKSLGSVRKLEERLEKSWKKASKAVEEDGINIEPDVVIVNNVLSNNVRTGDTDDVTESIPVSGTS